MEEENMTSQSKHIYDKYYQKWMWNQQIIHIYFVNFYRDCIILVLEGV